MRRKTLVTLLVFVLFFVGLLYARENRIGLGNGGPASPRLLYPIYDTVTLTGSAPLEFRWINDFTLTDHFIFKLYKGYNMYESTLIKKQNIPSGDSSVKIESDLFEDGKVYTWSIIRVATGGEKSDKSFNSFKVIRK